MDDLFPSGKDETAPVTPGTEGPQVGQLAPDFNLQDTDGNAVSLPQVLPAPPGAVLYFTMWCGTCYRNLSGLRDNAVPAYPDMAYLVLDYVSASPAEALATAQGLGWTDPVFPILADVGAVQESFYNAPMTVLVIGADRVIRYRGDYLWDLIQPVLESLAGAP